MAKKNFILMLSGDERGMQKLMLSESIGGNAGSENGLPCVATNFYFDNQTGKIICFGNVQSLSKKITKKFMMGTYRLALDLRKGTTRVIETIFPQHTSKLSRETIKLSVQLYNKYEENK